MRTDKGGCLGSQYLCPERTIYGITTLDQDAVLAGSVGMLRTPINEHPRFAFALSEAHHVSRETMISLMSARLTALHQDIEDLEVALRRLRNRTKPRRFLIEAEYTQSQLAAQATWITGLLDDLASGALEWPHLTRKGP